MKKLLVFIGLMLVLTGCSAGDVEAVQSTVVVTEAPQPTKTDVPTVTVTPVAIEPEITLESNAPTPTVVVPTAAPVRWQDWPVVPEGVSDRMVSIYQQGLAIGNDPNAFSKIGDCETHTTWFLYDFDQNENSYNLGPYSDLQGVIDYYEGSYERLSLATKAGFTSASIMAQLWADPEKCMLGETPLTCEFRVHNPSFAIVALGTNDTANPERFEENYRKVVETCIEHGVVPILATKPDNLEGDHRINETIVRVAEEYEVPLWNFWAAIQDLPDEGLQDDGAHLTWYPNDFSDPRGLEEASWPRRNLTALQVLEVVRQAVSE